MQIKTIADFMKAINAYFNGFPNDFVKELYADELSYIKPSDYQSLFEYIIGHNPASWRPDVKAIKDAVIALKIDTLTESGSEKVCPVCKTRWTTTGLCPVCLYDREKDGTPDQHRAWYEAWKRGDEPRFDVGGMLSGLVRSKTLPDSQK